MRRRGLFLGVLGLGALLGALPADAQALVDEGSSRTLDGRSLRAPASSSSPSPSTTGRR